MLQRELVAFEFSPGDVARMRVADQYLPIVTCRLHGIDPHTYLVDVLCSVSVSIRPPRVAELTPRQWKQHFAQNPLCSDLWLAVAGQKVVDGEVVRSG